MPHSAFLMQHIAHRYNAPLQTKEQEKIERLGGADVIKALDGDGLPGPLAAVDGAEPPAPQDPRRREPARARRQLRKRRRARLPRQRPRQRPRLARPNLPPRARQLQREVLRPRLGRLRPPRQGRRLRPQRRLDIRQPSLRVARPLLRPLQHGVALPQLALQLQHPRRRIRRSRRHASGLSKLLFAVGEMAASLTWARACARPVSAQTRLAEVCLHACRTCSGLRGVGSRSHQNG